MSIYDSCGGYAGADGHWAEEAATAAALVQNSHAAAGFNLDAAQDAQHQL